MTRRSTSLRRSIWIGVAVVILATLVFVGTRLFRSTMSVMAEGTPVVPTTRVERGVLDIKVQVAGELRSSTQQTVMAPPTGGALRVLSVVDSGDEVSAGDLILAFDPADQRYALEQAESELLEAEQNILKRQADVAVQDAQDQVALLTARFNVRRAELDAKVDRDLIPANEYQIRQVSLDEARKTLERTEQDVQARATVSKAGMAVLHEARMKAQMAADRARQNMEMLEVRTTIDGVVSVRENMDAFSGGVIGPGMIPLIRAGDTINPGRPVLDVFDIEHMEIRTNVNEQERVNLSVGQSVEVRSKSAPDAVLSARVQAISGLGRAMPQTGPLRRFDVTLALTTPDARLLPGTAVDLVMQGPRVDDALILPRQAVFEQDGALIVYVAQGTGFEPREIKVVSRGEGRLAVEGIDVGTEVALIRPQSAATRAAAAPASAAPTPVSGVGR